MLVRGRFVLVIALAAIGCGEAEPAQRGAPPPANGAQTFVGSLGRTDALVAVVQNGRDWLAYVCGGPATQAALTGWFQGRFASDTDATLEASASNGVIAAARAADEVHGSLESAGSSFSFDAERIDTGAAGVAGLFGALDSGCRTGLVVVRVMKLTPPATRRSARAGIVVNAKEIAVCPRREIGCPMVILFRASTHITSGSGFWIESRCLPPSQ